ncbi:hypothetical protein [Escherichia coli]|uniref:hypothetical protein n=1 Tax=Escherichia coli TaxID=562 RepID=UPI0021552E85|nr:hypothetical protein [Escherichia coli]
MGKAERLTWHKAWTMVSTGFSISYTCTFIIYIGFSIITQHAGQELPETFKHGFALTFCSFATAALVSQWIGGGLHSKLEERIRMKWQNHAH